MMWRVVVVALLLTTEVVAQTPADPSGNESAGWSWRLAGIVIDSRLRVALFAQDGDTQSLVIGDTIDGWTLTEIHPRDVTLRNAGQEMTLGLEGLPSAIADALAQTKLRYDTATRAVEQASQLQAQEQATAESALARATQVMRANSTR